jgi:hypothetical protein
MAIYGYRMPTKVSLGLVSLLYFGATEMRRSTHAILLPLAAAAFVALTAACNRDSVKVYKVDSSDSIVTSPPPVTATASAAMPGTMPATMPDGLPVPDNSGLPKLKYTLPAGWKEKPLTQLRVASFEVADGDKKADVSVIPLGGSAGGDAARSDKPRSMKPP